MSKLANDWGELLQDEFAMPYMQRLRAFLVEEYRQHHVYPQKRNILQALEMTPYHAVKAVILGQDPYHGPGQAHGLSFSVQPGVPLPPSLQNIYKELQDDLGVPPAHHGCLVHWAGQGVLLLNTVLTVRGGEPNSHKGMGWERFTDSIVELLNARKQPAAFILWGKHAAVKGAKLDGRKHLVLRSPHPSPLSAHRGFFGSKPFSRINAWLAAQGQTPIEWRLPDQPRP